MKVSPIQALGQWSSYLALRAARALILAVGPRRGAALMGWCWQTAAPWTKRHPRALAQIAASLPDLDPADRERHIQAMWRGLGQTFAEGLVLDRLGARDDVVIIENAALYDPGQSIGPDGKPRGMVIVSMHSGNWEVLGLGAQRVGLRAAALYQPVANPLIDRELRRQRRLYWTEGLIGKGSDAIKRTVGLLRAGQGVGIMADQRQAGGVAVPFFGQAAPSTPLPASLALRTGSRLIICRSKRLGTTRYALESLELDVAPTGDRTADIERVTATIHAQFEAWISERPSEWMWAHRRWSREVRRP